MSNTVKLHNLMYWPLVTGVRLRRLCQHNGLNATFNRSLGAWEITRDPLVLAAEIETYHKKPVAYTVEYILPEQLKVLEGWDMLKQYHPRIEHE